MNSLTPILHDLKHLEKFILKTVGLAEHYEIEENPDIFWNVVMAYLKIYRKKEHNLNDSPQEKEIKIQLKRLGIENANKNLIRCIKRYNPFLKRNAYFCEEIMNSVVKSFECIIREIRPSFIDDERNFNLDLCLEHCAVFLSCDILLVSKTVDGKIKGELSELYSSARDSTQTANGKVLIIFKELNSNRSCIPDANGTFSFGIDKEYGEIQQRIALNEILRDVKFSECETNQGTIHKILRLEDMQKNFLTSLIKSEIAHYVPIIYKSPYVLSKLQDAGFQTSPRVVNSENYNAFYYALFKENTSLLYFLYDYAANSGEEKENSIRTPNKLVIDNLKSLRTDLNSLLDVLKSESSKEEHLEKLQDVLRLNSFQIDVCSRIDEINEKYKPDVEEESDCESNFEENDSGSDSISDVEENPAVDCVNSKHINSATILKENQEQRQISEAKLRKEIILSILQTYKKYFYLGEDTGNGHELLNKLKQIHEHTGYFENIDFCSAVMFFDRIFLLKDRLKLPTELYTNIETKFFFFIYSKKYVVDCSKNLDLPPEELSKLTSVQVRLNLEKGIFNFNNELQNVTVSKDNVLKRLPEDLVHTLISLPLVYDEFLATRLKKYLDLATKISIENEKAIYIVQRALQSIGECLTNIEKPGFRSIKKILPLLLPQNAKQNLLKIRNKLSHIKSKEIERRNSVFDYELFKGIQEELRNIKEHLIPIATMAQSYTINRFVLDFISSVVNKAEFNGLQTGKKNFEQIRSSLIEQISIVNKENQEAMKEKNFSCSVKNLFESIRAALSNLKAKKENFSDLKITMDDYFWCVEFVLQYLAMDVRFINYQNELSQKKHKRYLNLFPELHQGNDRHNYSDEFDINGILFYRNIFEEINTTNETLRNNQESEQNTQVCNEKLVTNRREETTTNFTEESKALLEEYYAIADKMLDFQSDVQFSFTSIAKLRDRLNGKPYLTPKEEKELAKFKDKDTYKDAEYSTNKIRELLEKSSGLSEEDFKKTSEDLRLEMKNLRLDEKKQETFIKSYEKNNMKTCLKIINSIPDYRREIQNALDTCEIDKKKFDSLFDTSEVSEEIKTILKKLVKGRRVHNSKSTLEFLSKRVTKMKDILINEHKDIRLLWERAKNPKTKAYLKERITELYLTDMEVQAAVEMLLVDCMSVLHLRRFHHLWKKTTNLFSGINLRNVLAHGNPLLEIVGKLVDPSDLASEMVQNMIRLISDEKALKCMLDLDNLLKPDYDFFIRVVENSESVAKEIQYLSNQISKSEHWKEYVHLLKYKR